MTTVPVYRRSSRCASQSAPGDCTVGVVDGPVVGDGVPQVGVGLVAPTPRVEERRQRDVLLDPAHPQNRSEREAVAPHPATTASNAAQLSSAVGCSSMS